MNSIYTQYDRNIGAYVVSFPDEVSLTDLEAWGAEFIRALNEQAHERFGLLVDTNTHNFESIDCLKWLKDFLTLEHFVKRSINRMAFVQPAQYMKAEVVSDAEAYFSTIQGAQEWLMLNREHKK